MNHGGLLPVLFIGVLAIVMIALSSGQSKAIIENWAQENRFRIVEQSLAWFGGPFWLSKSRGQTVYRVTIEDANGTRRSGHVLCGSWWLGTWKDQATVKWDD